MLEDRLDFGANLQRYFRAHSGLDFERLCILEDRLNFGANFRAYARLDFERIYRLEDWLNRGANQQRQLWAHGLLDFTEAVCHSVRQLIDDESVKDILSVDATAVKLRAAGIWRFCTPEYRLYFGANRTTHFQAHSRLDFKRFCKLEDWPNRRRRFGAYSWLDLRFYTLEDRLNFGVGRQRRLRAGGWFDFERSCTLEDWLNFDANRQRHFRVCGWLDFERFCMFEGRRDFAADR